MLLLETTFLDIAGSFRNPFTFSHPVRYRTVRGATGSTVVGPRFREVAGAYVDTARDLQDDGVAVLTGNCGFAIAYQDEVRSACRCPTALSGLLLLPLLVRIYGPSVGVLTFDRRQLDDDRRRMVPWPDVNVPVADVQESAAWTALGADSPPTLDLDAMRSDVTAVARRFVAGSSLAALLLECTGMSPFIDDIAAATETPTYDLVGLTSLLLSAHSRASNITVP